MGVPPKSSLFFLGIFKEINHLFGGYPHDLGTPVYLNMICAYMCRGQFSHRRGWS